MNNQQFNQPTPNNQQFNNGYNQPTPNRQSSDDHLISPADAQDNKAMGILAYIGILWLIPLLAAGNSRFARFHANQGLVLSLTGVILIVLVNILSFFAGMFALILIPLLSLASGAFVFVLAIIGICNASQQKAQELPLIGRFRIIKTVKD